MVNDILQGILSKLNLIIMGYIADSKIKKLISKGDISIDPYIDTFQGPSCYYCHISNNFLKPIPSKKILNPLVNFNKKDFFKPIRSNEYILEPGQFVLAESFEKFNTNNKYTIRLFNSSSIARCGISHLALGMINPGCGMENPVRITLELVNNAPFSVKLIATKKHNKTIIWGTELFKISIVKMDEQVINSYDSWTSSLFGKDQHVAVSKMHKRYKNNITNIN